LPSTDHEVGQVRGRYRAGLLVDRGRVVRVGHTAAHGFCYAKIVWECGGQPHDEEHVLHVVTGAITYQELAAAGIPPAEFGCGLPARRTDCEWSLHPRHRALLRRHLAAQGFDAARDMTALEIPVGHSICLRQEVPAGEGGA
jgi:hypothetical protein